MHTDEKKACPGSPLTVFTIQDEVQLVQEERLPGEFDTTNCPLCLSGCTVNSNPDKHLMQERMHRQHVEWLREIRFSLFPLLLSCAIFILLIKIVFMIHEAESLIKFLQIVVGLFGATAGGYAYAQIRIPQTTNQKNDSIQTKTQEMENK